MFNSMTGYGRAQMTIGGRDVLVEIKSVNHRYYEFAARMPRAYGYLEEKLKGFVNTAVSRGKVEVGVSIFNVDGSEVQVGINRELAHGYVSALRSVKDELQLIDNLSLASIMHLSDVFQVQRAEEDENEIWEAVHAVAKEALARFLAMRKAEGERMFADIGGRLVTIENFIGEIETLSPQTQADYKARLYAKLNEVLEGKNIDEARVLTEVALFADKIAVDEETVRLRSHLKQFAALTAGTQPVGKKLDFLVQEMNREVNTIGSKCQDVRITRIVVELKSEIEKIREQIQNIE